MVPDTFTLRTIFSALVLILSKKGNPMETMIDLLRRGLEDQGCFVRPMQYAHEEDSGCLRVSTDDNRVFSVHFHPEA